MIQLLTPIQAPEYRALMLRAYAEEVEVFTSTVSEREPLPLEWWTPRVSDRPDSTQLAFGAFADARLVGVVGLRFGARERTAHRATIFGLYVSPEFRGQGKARSLMEAALDHARSRPGTRVVRLSVTETNRSAISLYEDYGFVRFGAEPLAVRYGEKLLSKIHMSLDLERRDPAPEPV